MAVLKVACEHEYLNFYIRKDTDSIIPTMHKNCFNLFLPLLYQCIHTGYQHRNPRRSRQSQILKNNID